MRRFLIILAPLLASASMFSVTTPAHAKRYAVCLTGGGTDMVQCGFESLAQCQATASGGLGSCGTSPGYTSNAYASYRGARKRNH
jgi:Protein of unknown function (DUF3551)